MPANAGIQYTLLCRVMTNRVTRRCGYLLDRPPEPVIGPAFGRTRWRAMTSSVRQRLSRLRQLQVDIRAVDDDVLDEDARLDLVALEIRCQHVDAEPAPLHRIELDRHRQVLLLHRTH